MKKSRYNHFFPIEDGKTLGINCLSGCMVILTQSLMDEYKKLVASLDSPEESMSPLIEELKEGKFLVDDDFNELSYLKIAYRRKQFDNSALALTILPTLSCNFHCWYCYEEKETTYMTKETENDILVLAMANLRGKKSLSVTWYGGEPLLAMNSIARISEGLSGICKAFGCEYSAQMVTNGYLLTRDVGLRLKEYGVKAVQVTIDGPRDIHNKRRRLSTGGETFDTIVRNLLDCTDLFHFIIRVNIDRQNVRYATDLLDLLCDVGLRGKADIYFAPTFDPGIVEKWVTFGKGCRDLLESQAEIYYDHPGFSEVEVTLSVEAIERGFPIRNFLNFSGPQCSAISPNGFVIEPTGALQKCWQAVGDQSKAIGHISQDVRLEGKILRWLSFEPFSDPACVECNILPLCMGSCPYRALENAPFSLRCSPLKQNLSMMSRLLRISEALRETNLKGH